MAPGSPGTKQIGMTTGRTRTAGRDDADEDWGPEEEAEYEDTEEDDAEDRDLSADSRESYENATPDLLASQEEPNPSTTGKQEIQKHTGQ